MSLARELAARSSALDFEDLPPAVVHWAGVGILDTVGVTLAGCAKVDEAARIVAQALAPSRGPSLVFGSHRRVAPLDAALINGTAAHALDFDDCSNTMCGHPSVPVLPALFALADRDGACGRDFLTAYVAGVETECAIARGAGLAQYTHGWHPTSTLGVFGAAAASARLLGLDVEHTATALAIAASFASGIKANFGTMTKPLHVGHCARNGLFAALLAHEGLTANAEAFEHPQGYLELFNGEGRFDAAAMIEPWGAPFDLERPALAIKQYPCCASTHPAIDALLEIVREHGIGPAEVARIDAWIHERRLRHTNRPDPASALDAKFSVQYCLARALTDGAVRVEHFEESAVREARVRAVLPRIHAAPYTTEQFPADNHFAGEVKVTTTDGRVLGARVDQALGRSATRPLPAARLAEKFEACATRVLSVEGAHRVREAIEGLEHLQDVRTITALLEHAQERHARTPEGAPQ
ncbi:MAG TPA: MmgE/PrpD family protein [Usitatibacter sp.]|nr:MmgE/PrpD family protein [Usitatibacter sp.]